MAIRRVRRQVFDLFFSTKIAVLIGNDGGDGNEFSKSVILVVCNGNRGNGKKVLVAFKL